MLGIPGLPIAAVLISRSLTRNQAWFAARRRLLWTAHLNWIIFLYMFVSMGIMVSMNDGKFGPEVLIGWLNRLLVLAYCAWLIAASSHAIQIAGRRAK
jgi:hypothetical protein